MTLRKLFILILFTGTLLSVSAEKVTLVQGENGYNDFYTATYYNWHHYDKRNLFNPWVTGGSFADTNSFGRDNGISKIGTVSDYCC